LDLPLLAPMVLCHSSMVSPDSSSAAVWETHL
jgi:hypothetical protein